MEPLFPVLGFLSAGEWAIVVLAIVLLFGATKIPELARSIGKAKGEFEKGLRDGQRETREAEERERVLADARRLGVPTEGRSLDDIRQDLRTRSS